MAGNFCAQNFICSLVFTKEISLRIDFENLRHPKRVWTYDFKGRRPSSFFSPFIVARLTQIFGIFEKTKKSNDVVTPFFT